MPGRSQTQAVNPPFPLNGHPVHHVNGPLPNAAPHSASPTVFPQQWRMMPPPGNLPAGALPAGALPAGALPAGALPVGVLPNPTVNITGSDGAPPNPALPGSVIPLGQSGQVVNPAGSVTPVNWTHKNQQSTSGPPTDIMGLNRPPPGLFKPSVLWERLTTPKKMTLSQ